MTVFGAIILTLVAFGFIAYPLFRERWRPAAMDNEKSELYSRRDDTYAMLKELEFDLRSGILTEEDYQDLEARYKKKGISILKDIDGLEKGTRVDEEIEREVREIRQTKATSVENQVEREIGQLRRSQGQFCPQCGMKHEKGDRFCSNCGARLRQGGGR
jgi:cytochrome c-type biogenesis protein CcmI